MFGITGQEYRVCEEKSWKMKWKTQAWASLYRDLNTNINQVEINSSGNDENFDCIVVVWTTTKKNVSSLPLWKFLEMLRPALHLHMVEPRKLKHLG